MTLEAWVRPTTPQAGWRTVILKERVGGLAYALYGDDSTTRAPAGYITIGGDSAANGTASLPIDTWTHLATTYDGAYLRLYVNGVQASSRAVTGSIATSASPLQFGGNTVWGEYFVGQLDEIRIFNGPRTQAEIQADMDTPVHSPPTISDVADTTTTEDTPTAALGFTVADVDTPAAHADSNGHLFERDPGADRQHRLCAARARPGPSRSPRPSIRAGTATITITRGGCATAARRATAFVLTVTAVNDLPTISDIAATTTTEDTPTPALSFTVGDVETPAAALTVTATSSNPTLVPTANIVLGGTGATRTVTITPPPIRAAPRPSPSP